LLRNDALGGRAVSRIRSKSDVACILFSGGHYNDSVRGDLRRHAGRVNVKERDMKIIPYEALWVLVRIQHGREIAL